MHRRGLRHGLVVVLFLTAAGAAAFAWTVDQQLGALTTAEHRAASRFDALVQAIARFDAAQQTFDASRESESEWFVRVQRLLAQIQADGAGLHASPASAAAAQTFDDVTGRVASAVAKAEENLRAGHELMAADLVQDEGRPGAEAMRAAVLEWRTSEAAAGDTTRYALLRQLWSVLGGTSALWALGVLLLTPRPAAAPMTAGALSILAEPAGETRLSAPVAAPEPVPAPIPAPVLAIPAVDLAPAAALCEDIGRADTPDAVVALLARATGVIGAAGVVIWLKGEGAELVPVAAHGYGPLGLALLGTLPLATDNVTTAAWHSGHMQSVAGDERSCGALAVPMFQGPVCTGVFAVELPRAGDTPVARALTGILAAQFGATVAPKPDAASASLEATGS